MGPIRVMMRLPRVSADWRDSPLFMPVFILLTGAVPILALMAWDGDLASPLRVLAGMCLLLIVAALIDIAVKRWRGRGAHKR